MKKLISGRLPAQLIALLDGMEKYDRHLFVEVNLAQVVKEGCPLCQQPWPEDKPKLQRVSETISSALFKKLKSHVSQKYRDAVCRGLKICPHCFQEKS